MKSAATTTSILFGLSVASITTTTKTTTTNAIHLTPDNYYDSVAGKSVFIKFYAPWCGFSKKLAPDWEKLTNKYEGSETTLIAEVDCAVEENQDLCNENMIATFPTIKFGDPYDLELYEGERNYDALEKFTSSPPSDTNFKAHCSPSHLELCDDEQTKVITKFLEADTDELEESIEEIQHEINELESEFRQTVVKMEEIYDKMVKAKDKEYIDLEWDTPVGILHTVKKHKLEELRAKEAAHEEL